MSYLGSAVEAITSSGLEENTDLQLDELGISDRKVFAVQELDESSYFTATDSVRNMATNTSQEPTDMTEDEYSSALEKKKIRTEAIALIRAQTQARLARMEALSEAVMSSQTSESDILDIPSLAPVEQRTTHTIAMKSGQISKKQKKENKKSKKMVPFQIGKIDSSNNQPSPSENVPRVQPLDEGVGSSNGPSYFTRKGNILELSPSIFKYANSKAQNSVDTNQNVGCVGPCVCQGEKISQDKHKITAQVHESCTERGQKTGTREKTYRDALLGTLDSKGKERVSGVDQITRDETVEYNATLHAHPTLLIVEEWPYLNEDITAETNTRDTSLSTCSGQEEEQSSTRSSLYGQPLRLSHSTRKSKTPLRDKLPPIQEVSSEVMQGYPHEESPSHYSERGSISGEAQSHLPCTPNSSKSTSTGWTSVELQGTPQTESSEIRVTGSEHQRISLDMRTASDQNKGSHAHPSLSLSCEKVDQPTAAAQKPIATQKPEGFFWQLDSHGFPCAKVGCEKRCNLWDGATVICPQCGPFSEIRYCCKEHLLENIKWHWQHCGQMTFQHPCREISIPRDVKDGPPLVPCLHPYDTPERHRQAIYFNAKIWDGDYFIFSDWADLVEAGFPENNLDLRCSSRVVYTVQFDDASEKDRFRRVLATCLFMTIEVTELVDYLFRLIRDKLRSQDAPVDLETALKYQFHEEFCVTIQQHITGERHACVTDWDGRNRRNCHDDVCRAEYRRLLGSVGSKGHCQLINHLESSYWILRAVRTTHPSVTDAKARMRGEGFSDVAKEDRKAFRRGEGWDGAGTGVMEIEGINDD
ncbi:uncharacterized protein BDW43DRAFT_305146 [Aspergillus alliaceus]|uniref:uncharacterized protein n=1 Tax=Petromyces alliaceus TaxID=209559 RepID=UPI0012A6836B|nr:uncharacterized protein BDW43DRAFT_305146 [Aspergillus alliaceus]KAB8239358.1 hypothetical protein BDW43DRAFT_305146 [Aspergillus alliaceus]